MTRIYKAKVSHGLYYEPVPRWKAQKIWARRLRWWAIDTSAEFRGWREENRTWRRLAHPYWVVWQWVDNLRPYADTIEEQNRQGRINAGKLGL